MKEKKGYCKVCCRFDKELIERFSTCEPNCCIEICPSCYYLTNFANMKDGIPSFCGGCFNEIEHIKIAKELHDMEKYFKSMLNTMRKTSVKSIK